MVVVYNFTTVLFSFLNMSDMRITIVLGSYNCGKKVNELIYTMDLEQYLAFKYSKCQIQINERLNNDLESKAEFYITFSYHTNSNVKYYQFMVSILTKLFETKT